VATLIEEPVHAFMVVLPSVQAQRAALTPPDRRAAALTTPLAILHAYSAQLWPTLEDQELRTLEDLIPIAEIFATPSGSKVHRGCIHDNWGELIREIINWARDPEYAELGTSESHIYWKLLTESKRFCPR
jgi:hypothetical protein